MCQCNALCMHCCSGVYWGIYALTVNKRMCTAPCHTKLLHFLRWNMPRMRCLLGLHPGPCWGSSRRSPRPLSRLGRGTPPPQEPHSPRLLRRLDPHAGARCSAPLVTLCHLGQVLLSSRCFNISVKVTCCEGRLLWSTTLLLVGLWNKDQSSWPIVRITWKYQELTQNSRNCRWVE